jgi:hypothetical protein
MGSTAGLIVVIAREATIPRAGGLTVAPAVFAAACGHHSAGARPLNSVDRRTSSHRPAVPPLDHAALNPKPRLM